MTPLATASLNGNNILNGIITFLSFLGQDDRNEVQLNVLGHVMPLLPEGASHNAYSIINGTIAFPT